MNYNIKSHVFGKMMKDNHLFYYNSMPYENEV